MIVIAGVVMGIVTALLSISHVNIIANLVTSGIVYGATLFLLREPLLSEIKKITGLGAIET